MLGARNFDIKSWLKGRNKPEQYEHVSFLLIFIAVAAVCLGTLLGSFVKYTVYIAAFGALLLLPALILYIASQLMEVKHETAVAQHEHAKQ
jgi:FtsH-binding integral membrane protein